MRWFVTGDIHSDICEIWRFIKKFDLGEGDNIIVCGDFGIFWNKDQRDARYFINQYEINCNGVHLYWIDGNHENFDIIDSWHAKNNKPYDNSEHIHYCPRGLTMNINNKKALFMGGADSIDKIIRKEGISWWPQEQITKQDIQNITGHYDYVFTHCCPYNLFNENRIYLCFHGGELRDITHISEQNLQKMFDNITFEHHYFGHYHVDKSLNDKHMCLYKTFIELK